MERSSRNCQPRELDWPLRERGVLRQELGPRQEPDWPRNPPLDRPIAARIACLQPSETSSLCCLRQARTRPPPAGTPAQSFCTSDAHAVRASEG